MDQEEFLLRMGFNADAVNRGTQMMVQAQKDAANDFKKIWSAALEKVGEFFAIGEAVRFGRELQENAHQIELLADRLNLTTDQIQRMQHAADMTGGSVEQIATAFDKLAKSKEDALGGNKKEAGAFSDFGLSISEVKKMEPEALFQRIADSIAKTGINAKVTADLISLLGRNGGELKTLLENYSKLSATTGIIPEQDIKNVADSARIVVQAKAAGVGIGTILLSGILHPFEMARRVFSGTHAPRMETNAEQVARFERDQAAADAIPWHGDTASKTVNLTKEGITDADKAKNIEKEIASAKETERIAGQTDGKKRIELLKQIAGLEHDIKGAPYEGLSESETAQLRLDLEKKITEEKNLQKNIDDEAKNDAREAANNIARITTANSMYPSIGQIARTRRSPFSGVARDIEQAQREQMHIRAYDSDYDYFNQNTLSWEHHSKASALQQNINRIAGDRRTLENAGVVSPELSLEKIERNTNALVTKLSGLGLSQQAIQNAITAALNNDDN